MRGLAGLLLLAACATAFAQQRAIWHLEEIAQSPAPAVTLHKGSNKTYAGTVSTSRARLIVDVKTRLEQQAGVAARLVLVEGNTPNAFSTPTSKAGPMVGLNLGMIEFLGDDADMYAAVLGHEYAHLTLRHREARIGRESVRFAGAMAFSILLASQGAGRGAADIANFASQAVSMTFSREEEHAADSAGMRYAAAAGFDPNGAVRTWERMAANGDRAVAFLSSHPASSERVERMRALAAELGAALPLPASAPEAEYVPGGVRIHRVLFSQSNIGVLVEEIPEGAMSTLRIGDRLVGCYRGVASPLALSSLDACRLPAGVYEFLVQRGARQEIGVLLQPNRP
jgi:Zn-dependent protease with chaperone function